MKYRVLVLGGYGNFGSFISQNLAQDASVQLILAGRSREKAETLIASMRAANSVEVAALDIRVGFAEALQRISPDLVIHTSGPFQAQSYEVAEACIEQSVNYIDLADGRSFVEGFHSMDIEAKEKGVLAISGASSLPCLSSALIDYYLDKFSKLESIDYGITTAQKTPRGLATTEAILSYTGKAFDTVEGGRQRPVYGWQSLHSRKYKFLGRRFLGNCDVPDLALFPKRYPALQSLRFSAGLQLPYLHLSLWGLSWFVRWGIIRRLEKAAPTMLRMSSWFDALGSDESAFHMTFSGRGPNDEPKTINFQLTARSGAGPFIPCMPAILLTRKLMGGDLDVVGAYPCMGFISRDEYLEALGQMDIQWEDWVT